MDDPRTPTTETPDPTPEPPATELTYDDALLWLDALGAVLHQIRADYEANQGQELAA